VQNYARLIGIDVGTKRIGLAQTDLLQTIASPVGTFSPEDVLSKIGQIAKEYPVERIIIGWPLTTDGEEGSATKMVTRFIAKLTKEFPDIPISKIDERYTSNKAKGMMIEIGIPKKKRRQKERVDRIAAAIILQNYLDATY
tara:strand:- start:3715 stop:4137 length:423 start_codon:yes stop_codon:yes gene_type:complete